MARPLADWQPYHDAARGLERELSGRVRRSMAAIRNRVSLSDLGTQIHQEQQMYLLRGKRIDAAAVDRILDSIVTRQAMESALGPAGTTAREAVMEGGHIGAAQLRRARKAA